MPSSIDPARVCVTDHALYRWAERIGLPDWRIWDALATSVPANRRVRRRIREAAKDGRWHRKPTLIRVDSATGSVFVIGRDASRSSGHARAWLVCTVLPLWACRVGGDVSEPDREAESCPAANA